MVHVADSFTAKLQVESSLNSWGCRYGTGDRNLKCWKSFLSRRFEKVRKTPIFFIAKKLKSVLTLKVDLLLKLLPNLNRVLLDPMKRC